MKLSPTMEKCLAWLADPNEQHGMPGGLRTMWALRYRGLAEKVEGTWQITDLGRIELGPVVLTPSGQFAQL